MNVFSAHTYVSPKRRALTPQEAAVRTVARELKCPDSHNDVLFQSAGHDMAVGLLSSLHPRMQSAHIMLVPVPSSDGTTKANHRLANAIADSLVAQGVLRRIFVRDVLTRQEPVMSSCLRRRAGEPGLPPEEHGIIRKDRNGIQTDNLLLFIDNVVTTGATMKACHDAMMFGDGLVYADAGRNIYQQVKYV
jgi:hypothetical protein